MRPVIALLIVAAASGCAGVRPVGDGAVYRSGQLRPERLKEEIEAKKIRTVVNLRGFEPQASWYRQEREVCDRLGVRHVDVDIDPRNPDREEVLRLIEVFERGEKPMLVHSRFPAGSVGFAAGLYRLAVRNEPKDAARRELAFWQSHQVPWMPLAGLDQFLYDWRSREEFLDEYQVAARRRSTFRPPLGASVEPEGAYSKDSLAVRDRGAPDSATAVRGRGAPDSATAVRDRGAPDLATAVRGRGAPDLATAVRGRGAPDSATAVRGRGAPDSATAVRGRLASDSNPTVRLGAPTGLADRDRP